MAKQAIDLSNVQSVKNDIHRDLIVTISGATNEALQRIKVNILRGVENRDSVFVYKGFQNVASAYTAGKTPRGKLGEAYERELVVKNVITYIPDNVQNYRTSEPLSMLGVSSEGASKESAIIQKQLMFQAIQFGNQVVKNFFHGDRSLGEGNPYGLYDGLLVKIEEDKTAGLISEAAGNIVDAGTIDLTNPVGVYDAYIKFVKGLHSDLRKNVVVITTEEMESAIIRGYALKFNNLQQEVSAQSTFRSFEARNAELISSTLLGTGTGFIAYALGNVDYATDLTGSEEASDAYIKVSEDGNDPLNSLLLGMQCASGTRLRNFNPQQFAISKGYAFVPEDIDDQELDFVEEDTDATQSATIAAQQAEIDALKAQIAAGPKYIYTAVDKTGEGYSASNPKTSGWFEKDGDNYVATEDTTVDAEKTYYSRSVG